MIKVTKVEPIDDKLLMLDFSDGSRGVFDCGELLDGTGPMIVPLKDATFFAKVFLENGAPTWPNGSTRNDARATR